MITGAAVSACRKWRYALWRIWDQERGYVLFVGLNPSTADENEDDPTILRMMGFARKWDYGGIYVVNLFGYRATDPAEMKKADDPVGPKTNSYLKTLYGEIPRRIACWGNHGAYLDRGAFVCAWLGKFVCLGTTKTGQPRHPLYLPKTAAPLPYKGVKT